MRMSFRASNGSAAAGANRGDELTPRARARLLPLPFRSPLLYPQPAAALKRKGIKT